MTDFGTRSEPGVTNKLSPRSVTATVSRLTGLIDAKGMELFVVIDQAAAARETGQDLRETVLVIFGNPAAGTPVIAAAPLAALDLPLRAVIWDNSGQTTVSYYTPAEIVAWHHVPPDLGGRLADIDSLIDVLVRPG